MNQWTLKLTFLVSEYSTVLMCDTIFWVTSLFSQNSRTKGRAVGPPGPGDGSHREAEEGVEKMTK